MVPQADRRTGSGKSFEGERVGFADTDICHPGRHISGSLESWAFMKLLALDLGCVRGFAFQRDRASRLRRDRFIWLIDDGGQPKLDVMEECFATNGWKRLFN